TPPLDPLRIKLIDAKRSLQAERILSIDSVIDNGRRLAECGVSRLFKAQQRIEKSLVLQLDRRADRLQDRLVSVQFQVIELTHDKHGASTAVETSRPACICEVEAEKPDVVSHGGLTGEWFNTSVRFQVWILFLQRFQRGFRHCVDTRHILAKG